MTEGIPSEVQAAEKEYLRRVKGVTLCDKVRSCDIHKTLNVEQFLRIERSQLRWFGHVSRMSHVRLARQVLRVRQTHGKAAQKPSKNWVVHIYDLAWPRLGVEPAELFWALSSLIGPMPSRRSQRKSGYKNERVVTAEISRVRLR